MAMIVAALLFAAIAARSDDVDNNSPAEDAAAESEAAHQSLSPPSPVSSSSPPLVEGLKFPSVSSITRPILGPLKKVDRAVKSIPKTVSKTAKATTKQVGKRVAAVEKKLSGIIRVVDQKITGGFKTAFQALAAAVTFLTNIPSCMVYYLLDALGWALYAPIAFLVWVFSLHALERVFWRYVDVADSWVHRATGVHPYHFSASVRNKCYFANIKEPPSTTAVATEDDGAEEEEEEEQQQNRDAQMMGTISFSVLCLALAWSAAVSA